MALNFSTVSHSVSDQYSYQGGHRAARAAKKREKRKRKERKREEKKERKERKGEKEREENTLNENVNTHCCLVETS